MTNTNYAAIVSSIDNTQVIMASIMGTTSATAPQVLTNIAAGAGDPNDGICFLIVGAN